MRTRTVTSTCYLRGPRLGTPAISAAGWNGCGDLRLRRSMTVPVESSVDHVVWDDVVEVGQDAAAALERYFACGYVVEERIAIGV